ncbi:MAG: hypothetical protein U9Q15_04950 [Patescibacteria group bacterium]|nr:hypothetical protein [Patescibacteria group bacterium]
MQNTKKYCQDLCQEVGCEYTEDVFQEFQKEFELMVGKKLLEKLTPDQSLEMMNSDDPQAYIMNTVEGIDDIIDTGIVELENEWKEKYSGLKNK